MKKIILEKLQESIEAKQTTINMNIDNIEKAATLIGETFKRGNKLLVCGNGGSAADALHICGEFTNRLLVERRPLPAMALNSDVATLTAIGNDYHFNQVFSKQVEAFGNKGDLLWLLTTSGNSKNQINAAIIAKNKGLNVLSFSGRGGGEIIKHSDLTIIVEKAKNSPRAQETQMFLYHLLIELVDQEFYSKK